MTEPTAHTDHTQQDPYGSLLGEESAASKERRNQNNAVPANAMQYLNEDQLLGLRQVECFGWHLAFIRRPIFQPCIVVLATSDRSQFAILETDGSMNTNPQLHIRH